MDPLPGEVSRQDQTDAITGPGGTQPSRPQRRAQLSALALGVLMGRAGAVGYYSSPEAAEAALVFELVRAGFDTLQIMHLLSIYPAAGVFAARKARHSEQTLPWLLDIVNSAQRHGTIPWAADSELATHLQSWIKTVMEMTQPEPTDIYVLQAHIEQALSVRALIYAAPRPRTAQISGLSSTIVLGAEHRLIARGLLEVVEPGKGPRPLLYRLLVPIPGMDSIGPLPRCRSTQRSVDDVFGSHGLGYLAHMVYTMLCRRPARDIDLQQWLKLTPEAVYYGLGPLVALGSHASGLLEPLAYQYGYIWYAQPADLAKVAEILFAGRWPVRM